MTATTMISETFSRFDVPQHLAATEPAEVRGSARDDVRMLVAGRDRLSHQHFRDLPQNLQAGDLLVVNTSATLPASLRASDGLEVHISTKTPGSNWVVEVRIADGVASRPLGDLPPPTLHLAGGGRVDLLRPYTDGDPGRLWLARVQVDRPLYEYLALHGEPIRYPYITEPWPIEAYQTVFGIVPGSAEMPSAARPFTYEIVTRLAVTGVPIAPIILHTGVSSLESDEDPYPEWYSVPEHTARLVNTTRAAGGRVIAVGTTVVRALESTTVDGEAHAGSGWTDLVIPSHHEMKVVDGLITGWHQPDSTHLAMLDAIAGHDVVTDSYVAALEAGYQWHEFGDLHLILSRRST